MNPLVGDRAIVLDGKKYTLHPCFEAFALMEDLAGAGVLEMYRRFSGGKPRIKDVACVVYACLLHGNNKNFELTFEQVGRLVMAEGVLKVSPIAFDCVLNALTSGQKKTDEGATAQAPTGSTGAATSTPQ